MIVVVMLFMCFYVIGFCINASLKMTGDILITKWKQVILWPYYLFKD